jgi:hypothetical protein
MGLGLADNSSNDWVVTQNGTGISFNHSDHKFSGAGGVSSIQLANGNAGWLEVPQTAQTTFHLYASSSYTIHMWIKFLGGVPGTEQDIVSLDNGSVNNYYMRFREGDGKLMWRGQFPDGERSVQIINANNLFDGNWHHLAVCQANAALALYIDGNTTTPNWGQNHNNSAPQWAYNNNANLVLFRDSLANTRYLNNVLVDEFEFVNERLWSSTFTPPTSPQTPIANTALLMHMDDVNYEISGTVSDDCRLVVYKESDWSEEYNEAQSAGGYTYYPPSNTARTILAVRDSDGKALSYGRVIPADL